MVEAPRVIRANSCAPGALRGSEDLSRALFPGTRIFEGLDGLARAGGQVGTRVSGGSARVVLLVLQEVKEDPAAFCVAIGPLAQEVHPGRGAPVVHASIVLKDLAILLEVVRGPQGHPRLEVLEGFRLRGPQALSVVEELRVDDFNGVGPEALDELIHRGAISQLEALRGRSRRWWEVREVRQARDAMLGVPRIAHDVG